MTNNLTATAAILAACLIAAPAARAQNWSNVDKYKAHGDKWAEGQRGKTYDVQKPGKIGTAGDVARPGDADGSGDMEVESDVTVTGDDCHRRLAVGSDTLFEFDKDTLTPAAEAALLELGPMIGKVGAHPVAIEGHTDAIGTDAYNVGLSERRARAVKQWLVAHGYLAATAAIKGFGESQPVAPNTKADGSDDPDGRRLNRRVVVVVDTCN